MLSACTNAASNFIAADACRDALLSFAFTPAVIFAAIIAAAVIASAAIRAGF